MNYCLDTNAVIDYLKGRSTNLLKQIQDKRPDRIKIPSIVRAELLFGALKSAQPDENRAKVELFLAPFEILDFDRSAADRYAHTRLELDKAGTPIGPNDLVIAATVLASSATLVTHNTREFSRVPGLLVEDWLS